MNGLEQAQEPTVYTRPINFKTFRQKSSCNCGKFPVKLYGVQTWSLKGTEQRIVQTCQRRMERRVLKVVWIDRVTNTEVRQRVNKKDIVAAAHSLKWKWGGHVS